MSTATGCQRNSNTATMLRVRPKWSHTAHVDGAVNAAPQLNEKLTKKESIKQKYVVF